MADRVVVNKSRRELLLFEGETLIRSYRIALGRNPAGPKQCEGDGKTPEGAYFISGRNDRSKFHRSLRISYPNEADRERARRQGTAPGGDIMIHGRRNGEAGAGDWTAGCIAVTNEEIEEIWDLVPDGTPVQINP